MNVNTGYLSTAPSLVTEVSVRTDALLALSLDTVEPAGTSVLVIIVKNGQDKWFNPATLQFEDSDGTVNEANTLSQLQAILPTELEAAYELSLKLLLVSDGDDTPIVTEISLTYDVAGVDPDAITTCEVVIDAVDFEGAPYPMKARFQLMEDNVKYKTNVLVRAIACTVTGDERGRIAFKLVDTENMELDADGNEQRYQVKIGNEVFYINVPDQDLAYFWDLVIEE
jgi:hypothetical protein